MPKYLVQMQVAESFMHPPSSRGTPRPDPAARERIVRLIEDCALFRGLPAELRLEAASGARERDARKGEVVFYEGDPVEEIGVLARGRIKINTGRPPVLIQLLGPEGLCDWPGMLTDGIHSCTAVAAAPSLLLVWERPRLVELFDRHPALYHNALRILARRQRELSERYRELATLRVPQRLARTLLRVSRPAGCWLDEGGPGEIPLSRRELAQLAGTTLFTVSRFLKAWEGDGILEARRGSVRVEKPGELAVIGLPDP